MTSKAKYITGRVSLDVNDIINWDFEQFLDALAEGMGNPLLMDIAYKPVKIDGDGLIVFEVDGDDSERETV